MTRTAAHARASKSDSTTTVRRHCPSAYLHRNPFAVCDRSKPPTSRALALAMHDSFKGSARLQAAKTVHVQGFALIGDGMVDRTSPGHSLDVLLELVKECWHRLHKQLVEVGERRRRLHLLLLPPLSLLVVAARFVSFALPLVCLNYCLLWRRATRHGNRQFGIRSLARGD